MRGAAQLGALAGLAAGAAVAARLPCRHPEQEFCTLDRVPAGLALGSFAGSALGATLGGRLRAGCPAGGSALRALGGAALWGAPAAAYFALVPARRRVAQVSFLVALSVPLLQAEDAARAASACPGRR